MPLFRTISRRSRALLVPFAIAASLSLGACRPAPDTRPNLVLLLADDLGWGDPGSYGGTEIRTPQLDRLAERGMRWTQFYAASAICSPSRCSCLTGRYPSRFGFTRHLGHGDRAKLPPNTVTVARLLRQAGYATAHVGKWHLGGRDYRELGFEETVTVHYRRSEDEEHAPKYVEGARHLVRNGEPIAPSERYLTDALVDESIRFIDHAREEGRPFFLNLWFYAPHTPYTLAPEPCVRPYAGQASGDDLKYRSMVTCMDAGIGRLIAHLERLGIERNTLVLFTSDNGPSFQGSSGPFRGGKADLHEGGIRVPMIAFWPGHIEAGSRSEELGHTNDLLPTFCAAAGVELPGDVHFDGIDLLPRLAEGRVLPDRGPLFWQMDLYPWSPRPEGKPEPQATEAVRRGRFKLLALGGRPVGLFDLEADPREEDNLVDDRTDVRDALASDLTSWLKDVSSPPPR